MKKLTFLLNLLKYVSYFVEASCEVFHSERNEHNESNFSIMLHSLNDLDVRYCVILPLHSVCIDLFFVKRIKPLNSILTTYFVKANL